MARPDHETRKAAEARSATPAFGSTAGDATDPFGFSEWLQGMREVPLHPLMQHPAAMMAAATAVGFGVTSHVAGFMLGAVQGMAEAAQKATGPAAKVPALDAPSDDAKRAPVKAPVVKKPKESKAALRAVDSMADDLKRISGIGPKLEQLLNRLNIRRYSDIAAWTDEEVRQVDDQLGLSGRVVRDGWVAQAEALAKG